jgi:hypothetical protein
MTKLVGKLRQPESNRKKYVIVSVIIAVVCLSASGGLYYIFKGSSNEQQEDDFGRRFRLPPDANLPNAEKQSPQEILGYMDSAAFKQLTAQQRMRYTFQSSEKVMDYQMDTYFSLPAEQKTAFLDKMIDKTQAMRSDFEQARQARQQMPQRRPLAASNPNRPREQNAQGGGQGGRRAPNPARMRARSERGTPEQRAKREQFLTDLRKRAEQRGITMPGPGGMGGR